MFPVLPCGLWLFLLLFFSYPLASQTYHASTRSIGQLDGLSHHKILSFYPDADGMWIGTQDGLNFFDGYNWQYWTKADGHFQHSMINFLLKDQAGYLWVFHTKWAEKKNGVLSVNLLYPSRDSIIDLYDKPDMFVPFQVEQIQGFFGDDQNRLYFTANEQLWRYSQAEQFQQIVIPTGFIPQSIFSDGTLIGRLDHQLTLVSSDGEVLERLDYPLEEYAFQLLGNRDQFWVQQAGGPCKFFQLQAGATTYTDQLFPLQQDQVSPSYLLYYNVQQKELWINSGDTIYLLNQEGKRLFQMPGTARRVTIDKDGNYWFGKHKVNILRLQKRKFRKLLHKEQALASHDNEYQCRGLYEKNGQLIVGTYKGIRMVHKEDGQLSKSPLPTGQEKFFAILEDRKQRLWLAYDDLIRLSSSNQAVVARYDVKGGRIWSLYEDQNDLLWLGSENGLHYLKEEKIQTFDQYNGFNDLKEALILFFYEDKEKRIWVGSNEGLYQLELEKGITAAYNKKQSKEFYLPAGKFQHMHQDTVGIYWLATEDAGLIRWDKEKGDIKTYDKASGMLTNNIYSVYEDNFGFLWMSSVNGLIRFDKTTESLAFFHEEDGICYDEFNRISHYQATDGDLYFGGQNGVTAFDPRDLLTSSTHDSEFRLNIGHVSIIGKQTQRDVWADGSPIDLEALPSDTRTIDLELEGSNLFWAGNTALHSTLERLGDAPKITSRENISYSNHIELFEMLPGTYKLKVKAVQDNGKQLGESLEVAIRIQLPFYQTSSFWLISGLVVLLAFFGITRWPVARFRRHKSVVEDALGEEAKETLQKQQTDDPQVETMDSLKKLRQQRDEEWLKQFQSIIEQRIDDPSLYLPDIINDMNISRTAFYEKVKRLSKMTPNQYIQELRLTKAKAILDDGQVATVKEVAHAVGMKEPKYFSKRFKERFGILPSTYFRNLSN